MVIRGLDRFSPYSISVVVRLIEIAFVLVWAFLLFSPTDPLNLSFEQFTMVLLLSPPVVLLWTLVTHPLGRCRNCGKSPLHISEPLQDWVYLKTPWRSMMRRWKLWPDDECKDCRAELTSLAQSHD